LIGSFSDKVLKRFFLKRASKGIDPLSAGFHPLKGNRAGQFAVTVRAQFRIVFEWRNGQAVRVRQEDYHGR
jgi:toxin HigB-1